MRSPAALVLAALSFGAAAGVQGSEGGPGGPSSLKQAAGQEAGGPRQLSVEQRAELRRQLTQFSRRPGKAS